jgi:predicted dehydrogenase
MQYREAPDMVDVTGWGAGHNFGRAHRYYRWFYEYSGGKLTDWGAHHVDVALWAMNRLGEDAGKVTIKPISVNHPVKLDENGYPTEDDRFNCAIEFNVLVKFEDGLELYVRDKTDGFDNGIMFEGDKGRYFVNRGKITGKPVEDLKNNPLDEARFNELYVSGERPEGYGDGHDGANMKTFMECIKSRKTPSSDVASHNKAMNICHAINIAMRLNRELTFDTKAENFVGDDQANTFVSREQRKGYEIDA